MSTTYINKLTMKTGNPFVILHSVLDPLAQVCVQASTSATVYTGANVADALTVVTNQIANARILTVAAGINQFFDSNSLTFNNVVVSQDIYGGALSLDAKGKVNKVGVGAPIASVNEVAIGISGGQVRTVFGGGAGYGSVVDNVAIEIENAQVNQIYGGGADGAVVGNVAIEIGGGNIVERGSRIGAIYAGGRNATVTGDVAVVFTAGSAALKFSGTVSGIGAGKDAYVLGESTLSFRDYAGQFAGRIQSFDTVRFIGMSQVGLTKGQDRSLTGADLEFVLTDDSIGNTGAMLTWDKKFKVGGIVVTIADDGDYAGESTEALLNQGGTIALVGSKSFKTVSDFDMRNLRVQNEAGELIADYSYDINYIFGKKGGEVSITYTGAPLNITGQYIRNLNLTGANDYVNVVYGSIMAGSINMGAGRNKLVVQIDAAVTGEVIFAANSTNTVLVNGFISGLFDSQEGSVNTVRLNAGWGIYYNNSIPTGSLDFVGSGNDTVVVNSIFPYLSGIHFGKGDDVLVLNAVYDGNVSYEDGNDVIVANVNLTLDAAKLGLQGTGNALAVGNGREVTIDNTWFGTGTFGTDTGAKLAGVYLNDNASLLVVNRGGSPDLRVIQNYTGDIMFTAGDIYIMGANAGAPAALSQYYTNSGTGFNGNILVSDLSAGNNTVTIAGSANGTIALSKGDDVVNFVQGTGVVGGADLYLGGVEAITVAADTIAMFSNFMKDEATPDITLEHDAKLIVTDKKKFSILEINGREYAGAVLVKDLTRDADFGDAVYQGSGVVSFQLKAEIDADLTFNNQVVIFNDADSVLGSTFTFEGASMLGFFGKGGVWDWQDTTLAVGATLGVYGDAGAQIRIDGQISDTEIAAVIANSALNGNAMLGIADTIYLQNWHGDYSDAANWMAPEAGTRPFEVLTVMDNGLIRATAFAFGDNAEVLAIGDGVTMRGQANSYDYVAISGDDGDNTVFMGESDIYGVVKLDGGEDFIQLNGTIIHTTADMSIPDEGMIAAPVVISMGADDDMAMLSGATVEGSVNMGNGSDMLIAVGTAIGGNVDMGKGDDLMIVSDVTVAGSAELGAGDNRLSVIGTRLGFGFEAAAFAPGEVLSTGGNVTIAVFDDGVLSSANGESLLINEFDNSTSANTVIVGRGRDMSDEEFIKEFLNTDLYDVRSSGTVAVDLIMTGAANTVLAGVNEDVNYGAAGLNVEQTIFPVEIPAGLTATIDGDVVMRSGSLKGAEPAGTNSASYGVQVIADGSYEDPAEGPDKHKLAEADFLGAVTVNMTGVTMMGDAFLERSAAVYSSASGLDDLAQNSRYANVAAGNTFQAGYKLNALQEGVINVGGNVAINAGDAEAGMAVGMTGQSNTLDMGVDVYAGEQAKLDINDSTVAIAVNGDVDMLAVGVNGNARNVANIGVWRLDNWDQATSPYGNGDSDTADGILLDTDLEDYSVVLDGDLTMYGVGSVYNGDAYNVENYLHMMRRSTITGDVKMGEYYRDTWTYRNFMYVDEGTVFANARVDMIGLGNGLNFFGTGGSTKQTFSLYGIANSVNVGGMNTSDVWDTETDQVTHSYTSYGAVIGNITLDNLFDSDDDQFAAQDYLNGMVRTAADYAQSIVFVTGSTVDGNLIAYGTTTIGNVTGANSVTVQSVTSYAATVTGNIELTSNDNNGVRVYGVNGARAGVGGHIIADVDEVLTLANSNIVTIGLATTGDITTTLEEESVGGSNINRIQLGQTDAGAVGDAIVGDVDMSAAGSGINQLFAATDTSGVGVLAADSARRANTIGDVLQFSETGGNIVNIIGQGVVTVNAPSVDGGNIVTQDNNVVAPTTAVGFIMQLSYTANNMITLVDAVADDITMATDGNNTLIVQGSKTYAVGQDAAMAPQNFITGIAGEVFMEADGAMSGNTVTMIGARFEKLDMLGAVNSVSAGAGSEITGALTFDDPTGLAVNSVNDLLVANSIVGSVSSLSNANDTITIAFGVIGDIAFGGGSDWLLGTGTVGAVTVTNLGIRGNINAGSNDITGTGTGTLRLVEGLNLTAGKAGGFAGIVLDYTDAVPNINPIDSNVSDWDELAELDNLDVIINSGDLAAGSWTDLITADQNFTGTNAIDLTINYGGGSQTTISLAWSAADNAFVSGTAVDGKHWRITGHNTDTLTLAATV